MCRGQQRVPRTRGHGKRRSIFATVPAVSTRGVAISACPALRAYSDATHRILLPYLPVYRPPLPHTLVSDCTVPCRYVVHTGYAYPSALLWADLLSNKVGPSQNIRFPALDACILAPLSTRPSSADTARFARLPIGHARALAVARANCTLTARWHTSSPRAHGRGDPRADPERLGRV